MAKLSLKTRASLLKKAYRYRTAKDFRIDGQWPNNIKDMPWYDQPDAQAQLDRRQDLAPEDRATLQTWLDKGYVTKKVMPGAMCDRLIDSINTGFWEGREKFPKARAVSVRRQGEDGHRWMRQTEAVTLSAEEREWVKTNSNWRIHDLMKESRLFYDAAHLPDIIDTCSLLFGRKATTDFSLSFGNGSEQPVHQDNAFFHIYPRNHLIGCWIALEDIHPDSGPLVYYPGSHRIGMWPSYDANYPETNFVTVGEEDGQAYLDWLRAQVENTYPRETFIVKKGNAIFWHAALAHGGSARLDPDRTRHSYVLHLTPEKLKVNKRHGILKRHPEA
ncbi:MAG: hypothetical protein EP335_15160 [Alphaproteobacteria bacterium]|nr:MAG: hypothetical protein EP335_15160 [Alphaproteobacteria bacterium]